MRSICSVEDCGKFVQARGLCDMHYQRMRKHGSLDKPRQRGVCSIEGCEKPHKARGYCTTHWQRWKKWGDPHADHSPVAPTCSYDGCEDKAIGFGLCRKHYDRMRNGRPLEGRQVPVCAICSKPHHSHGLCRVHATRLRKHGDPFFDGKNYPLCSIPDCSGDTYARGWCHYHYDRWRACGDPIRDRKITTSMGVELDFAPVEGFLDSVGGLAALMDRAGPDYANDSAGRDRVEKYLDRARKAGVIDLAFADDFACKVAQLHPALLWGDDYWAHDDEEETWQQAA